MFFGYGLAKLEAPDEIEANNDIIASRAVVNAATQFHGNVTESLPTICLHIFTQNLTLENLTLEDSLAEEFDDIFANVIDKSIQSAFTHRVTGDEIPTNNSTELLEFMSTCGKTGLAIANSFTYLGVDYEYAGDSLSFNWIRCDGFGNSSTLGQQLWGRPFVNRTRLQPDAQAAAAVAEWRVAQRELYNGYMDSLMDYGARTVDARVLAFRQSMEDANGFGHCYPNSAAGAWFWFTVMTTVGTFKMFVF